MTGFITAAALLLSGGVLFARTGRNQPSGQFLFLTALALLAAQNGLDILSTYLSPLWQVGRGLRYGSVLLLMAYLRICRQQPCPRLQLLLWLPPCLLAIILPPLRYSLLPPLIDAALLIQLLFSLRGNRSHLITYLIFLSALILNILQRLPLTALSFPPWPVDFFSLFLAASTAVLLFRAHASSPFPDIAALPVSPREREVIRLILEGETNQSIADRLFISPSTVKKHINSIFRKLKIRSRWELVRIAGALHPKE